MDYVLAAGPGRTAFARFWGLLAKEAAAHPSAFAAELMNEPVRQPRRHHHRHSPPPPPPPRPRAQTRRPAPTLQMSLRRREMFQTWRAAAEQLVEHTPFNLSDAAAPIARLVPPSCSGRSIRTPDRRLRS